MIDYLENFVSILGASTLVCRSLAGIAAVSSLSWRMYPGFRCWPPSSAVCWQWTCLVKRSPVRWPLFCHRWTNAVEQLRQPDITFGQ